MSQWLSPSVDDLKKVITSSTGDLLLCSPYISKPGLNVVAGSLPPAVNRIEVWTKLDPQDWLTGASDPEGLLDFTEQVEGQVGSVSVRHSLRLHAKVIASDGPLALAGSANLTAGGFGGNLEVVRFVSGDELSQLRSFVDSIRPRLTSVTLDQFKEFVSQCVAKIDSQEALLALIREEMPPPDLGPQPLVSYSDFLAFLNSEGSPLAADILTIARNLDNNNNTGKVKQAFYGIQRFLQEYPQHRSMVAGLPDDEWFDVARSQLASDWGRFLQDYSAEVSPAYGYSVPTLIGYLTPSSGGIRTGSGGGDNELNRVWPFVGRVMTG